ncbi:MAG: phosphatase PAP2 family protein [Dokdonella sp.]
MRHRLLIVVALVAATLVAIGLAGVDYPLARWVQGSGIENVGVFRHGLEALDTVFGLTIWYWLAGTLSVAFGVIALLPMLRIPRRLAVALLVAGIVQFATLQTMIQMKGYFGRLRPHQVFDSGDWNVIWHAGGGSFPSGHSAFYFGLLLPLAAFAGRCWQRALLLAIPLFAVIARIDMSMHFLSDVSMSALIAATYALLATWLVRAPVASSIERSCKALQSARRPRD